jgi:hypothetical protein
LEGCQHLWRFIIGAIINDHHKIDILLQGIDQAPAQ